MSGTFCLDGEEFNTSDLTAEGRACLERLSGITRDLQYLKNQRAVLNKAKNAYIADLRHEIVTTRSGVDLKRLLGDD